MGSDNLMCLMTSFSFHLMIMCVCVRGGFVIALKHAGMKVILRKIMKMSSSWSTHPLIMLVFFTAILFCASNLAQK